MVTEIQFELQKVSNYRSSNWRVFCKIYDFIFSLQSLIDKPPVGGRELAQLSESALQGFRLMPGSVGFGK